MLDSEADVGMNGPLIDNEGYPRNDIDIVKVRTARQKIICLMNDHKEIMKKISDALECIHQQNSNGTGKYYPQYVEGWLQKQTFWKFKRGHWTWSFSTKPLAILG